MFYWIYSFHYVDVYHIEVKVLSIIMTLPARPPPLPPPVSELPFTSVWPKEDRPLSNHHTSRLLPPFCTNPQPLRPILSITTYHTIPPISQDSSYFFQDIYKVLHLRKLEILGMYFLRNRLAEHIFKKIRKKIKESVGQINFKNFKWTSNNF